MASLPSVKPIFIHVPKTGGSTIGAMFGEHIVRHRHLPAFTVRDKVSDEEWTVWRFGFVRNPWDRVASWYWSLEVGRRDHRLHREGRVQDDILDFESWCKGETFLELKGIRRNAEKMLTDPDTGELLVHMVYTFEHFDDALKDIAVRLGVTTDYKHENTNLQKPKDADYRDLYTSESYEAVEKMCAWEIEACGYEFDQLPVTVPVRAFNLSTLGSTPSGST